MLLNVEHLYKYFNGQALLKDINFTVEDREAVGLIGVNGCGKSTLLNIITGSEGYDKTPEGLGSVNIAGKASIGFLRQNSGLNSELTIGEEMKNAFAPLLETLDKMKVLEKKMADGGDIDSISHEYAELSSYFEVRDGYRIDVKIKQVLNGMGFGSTPTDRVISTLSGGEKTRLALAKLLLEEPNLLILDEPTNHLDFETLMWLEDYLKGYKGAIIIVSHDRYFLNKVCTRICEIEQGRLTSYRGDYSSYLVQKKMNSERQLKEYEAQQKEIAKLEDYVAKNLVRASTSKMAKSRQHMLDRIERIDKPLMYTKPPKIKLEYDIEPTKDIVRVVDCPLVVGEGADKKELIKSLTMNVRRGEHVAIIGANGIGKTSILKLIQGIIPHDGGNISWGGNVKISYFEQEHAILDPHKTVLEEIMDRYPRLSEQQARSVLGAVLLTGENVFKPISVLSGGERAKLCFAIMALNRGNVLVLDEPTNHLDLSTKEVLEDALAEFGGTIILVSHDRYLLNKVASRIIEIKHDEVNSYEGNFDAYSEAVNAARQLKMQSEAEIKRAEEEKAYKENKAKQYRSKEQRAADAQKRNRIRELEKEIEDTEVLIFELENAISDPEIASDYSKMSEKCKELEEAKTALDQKMDEWAELSDQLS
ncbi:ABC-F family ATP-binding cassette domain-containing protein [Ruminococcus bicirculans (ex Wegman et al. 2014)]|uniref:ABC-F family ATP-binding cassette domain-containing protein n=1 Tax=Ruminococcus bicirculans (ex Wegman et al. 2014) TaxID=1160721 RepID=UPI00095E51FB|nr:ABC-F family ATP-binding cassette domain-containing protein [Ruminococcus bicirculans (ex Wegman et al. 2014)]OLA45731.1 MAG: ABC transporter [Ruminococcus bicirculans (ex Wegman et al. 2014)]